VNDLPLLDDLRLFCTVARKNSFGGAASELGASPAFVSKRIAILERSLKVRLMHRNARKFALTEDGENAYQWAQKLLEAATQMADSLSKSKSTPRGLLRVCTSTGFGRHYVAPAVSQVALRHPDLHVQLEFLDRPVDLIGEGFDVDIRLGQVREQNLIARRIGSNTRVLCASPAFVARQKLPTTLSDLARLECIAIRERDQAFSFWRLQGPNGEETVKVTGPLSANNGETAHEWALSGHGVILRSMWDVGRSIRSGQLLRILPDYFQEADVWAVYPSRVSSSAKVRVFVELLQESLKSPSLAWTIEDASGSCVL
jgi:LysR family transcriptional regulator, transcriptional activator for dmlA